MKKRQFKSPFLVINPKAYLFGEKCIDLALYADELAIQYDVDIFFTAQLVDLVEISKRTKKVIPTSQHVDALKTGRGMGFILPDALAGAGIQATFLNHAEHPITLENLVKTLEICDETGLISIVCANTLTEAKLIASLNPDIVLCEPTELIGTGKTSDADYITYTTKSIKEMAPQAKVLQAAGISTGEDVYNAIKLGADGSGGTSGIVCAANPKAAVKEMILALVKIRDEKNKQEVSKWQ